MESFGSSSDWQKMNSPTNANNSAAFKVKVTAYSENIAKALEGGKKKKVVAKKAKPAAKKTTKQAKKTVKKTVSKKSK